MAGFWDAFGSFWELLGTSGSFWEHLEASGSFRELLGASETLWEPLGASGISGNFASLWDLLGVSGSFWEPLGVSGIVWEPKLWDVVDSSLKFMGFHYFAIRNSMNFMGLLLKIIDFICCS